MVDNIIEMQRAVFLPAIAWHLREGSLLSEVVFTLFLYRVLLGASEADPENETEYIRQLHMRKNINFAPQIS